MGGWVKGKIDVTMLLIRTSWDKSTKCEVIKCIGQKQSKGDKKWIPNRTPNKPVNSYHSYDLTSQCLCSAHILSVYVGLIFTECFYVTHNIWQHFKTNRTVTFLIISLKSEMLWGLEFWTICSTHWKVLMAIDQARCERSTHSRPKPRCSGIGRLSIWSYLI